MQSLLNEIFRVHVLGRSWQLCAVCKFLADMAALRKKMPNNELVSFVHEVTCGSRFIAFSLSYLRQEHLFTAYT